MILGSYPLFHKGSSTISSNAFFKAWCVYFAFVSADLCASVETNVEPHRLLSQRSSLCSLINTLDCKSKSLKIELSSNQDFLNPKPDNRTASPKKEEKPVRIKKKIF